MFDNCNYTSGADEPPNKKARHDHTTTSEDNDQASSSNVWECFTELLEEAGATSNVGGGAEGMVDNYLSEPLIDYKKVTLCSGGMIMAEDIHCWEVWHSSC